MNKLTKKTYKNYEKLSRYSPFPIYYNNEDKKYIGGVTSWLSSDSPFSEYQVKKGDSLDLLSLKTMYAISLLLFKTESEFALSASYFASSGMFLVTSTPSIASVFDRTCPKLL